MTTLTELSNTIATPPNWGLHRRQLAAADGAISTVEAAGVEARGYRWGLIDLVHETGALTNLSGEVLVWSPGAGKFVSTGLAEYAFTALTVSTRIAVPVYGQRFWVYVSTLTGTAPRVDIYVAGFSEPTAH